MANPPITIGPFNSVPAPGSPIRSDWPQAVSTFLSRHGCGLTCTNQPIGTGVTADLLWTTETYDTDGFHAPSVANIVIPTGMAGIYLFSVNVDANGTLNGLSHVTVHGGTSIQHTYYMPSGSRYGAASATFEAVAGGAIKAVVFNGHSGTVNWTARMHCARISA